MSKRISTSWKCPVLSDYLEERGLCQLTVEAIRKEAARASH